MGLQCIFGTKYKTYFRKEERDRKIKELQEIHKTKTGKHYKPYNSKDVKSLREGVVGSKEWKNAHPEEAKAFAANPEAFRKKYNLTIGDGDTMKVSDDMRELRKYQT